MAPTSFDAGRVGHWKSSRLPKSRRLNRQKLIQPLFDRDNPDTRTISSGHIRLLYRWVSLEEVGCGVPVQVGFAVSRSIGGAVVRNRVKRILRDTYRSLQGRVVEHCAVDDAVMTLMVVVRRLPKEDGVFRADLEEAISRLFISQEHARAVKRTTPTSGG